MLWELTSDNPVAAQGWKIQDELTTIEKRLWEGLLAQERDEAWRAPGDGERTEDDVLALMVTKTLTQRVTGKHSEPDLLRALDFVAALDGACISRLADKHLPPREVPEEPGKTPKVPGQNGDPPEVQGKNEDDTQENPPGKPGKSPDEKYCPICDMWVNGPKQMESHVIGRKHRKNSNLQEVLGRRGMMDKGQRDKWQ